MLRNIHQLFKVWTKEKKFIERGFKDSHPTMFFYQGEFVNGRGVIALVSLVGDSNFRAGLIVTEARENLDLGADTLITSYFTLESVLERVAEGIKTGEIE